MPRECRTIFVDGKAVGIACGERRRAPKCSVPGCDKPGNFQCDFRVGDPSGKRNSTTCDAHICIVHAKRIAFEKDLCPPHDKIVERAKMVP
jgi:hypothetical protein